MSGYRAMHRKAVAKPSSSTAVSVELLQTASTPGEDSFTRGEYVGDITAVDEDHVPLKQPSAFRIFLRTMQLDTIWNGFRSLAGHGVHTEDKKQAVIKSFPLAIVTLIAAHFLPLGGAMTLVVMNIRGYYLGGGFTGSQYPSTDVKLSLLQFAAKAHEVMMQASLSVIVIGLIRHELVVGEGIPFGAIFGSLQFTNISYLFSKEFMGMVKARLARPLVKVRLIALLFVGAVLAVTVGPSSAIAMRPRLDDWQAGGTDIYLNTTAEELWPSQIDASAIPISCRNITVGTNCISKDWDSLTSQILAYYPTLTVGSQSFPEIFRLNSPRAVREMYVIVSQGLYSYDLTLTTTPMSSLADVVADTGRLWAIAAKNLHLVSKRRRRFEWRKEAIYQIKDLFQPATAAHCSYYSESDGLSKDQVFFPTYESMCNSTHFIYGSHGLRQEEAKIVKDFHEGVATTPQLQFVDISSDTFGNNTKGAIVTLPPSWPGGSKMFGCRIDSRWSPSWVESRRYIMKAVTSSVEGWILGTFCDAPTPSVHVTNEWMEYLNPYLHDTNKTVFHTLMEGAGSPSPLYVNMDDGYRVYYQSVVETILSSLTTMGLSHTASDATIQGQLKGCTGVECGCGAWCLSMMPSEKQEFGYGGNIYNMSEVPDISKLTKFVFRVDVNGYAYNIRGASMVLSCVVLTAYSSLVLVHIVFVLIKRTSSTSFDTVSEVVSLAMQSQPTDRLHNTSAGIYTTKVFSNLVKLIRTGHNKDHLELDFGDHEYGGDKIVEGEFYG